MNQMIQYINNVQSNLYIKDTQKGNLKMSPLLAGALYKKVEIICTIFINGENETVLYRQ